MFKAHQYLGQHQQLKQKSQVHLRWHISIQQQLKKQKLKHVWDSTVVFRLTSTTFFFKLKTDIHLRRHSSIQANNNNFKPKKLTYVWDGTVVSRPAGHRDSRVLGTNSACRTWLALADITRPLLVNELQDWTCLWYCCACQHTRLRGSIRSECRYLVFCPSVTQSVSQAVHSWANVRSLDTIICTQNQSVYVQTVNQSISPSVSLSVRPYISQSVNQADSLQPSQKSEAWIQ